MVPTIIVETSTHEEPWASIVTATNWLIWVAFAAELAFVLTVAPRKLAALRAHWLDAAIVVFTVPFLPTVLGALRFLRAARVLRLLRVVRLALFAGRALSAARVAFSPQGFRYAALATGLLVVVAGFGISIADAEEFRNPWVGIWWAVATVTTVGYGDFVPETVAGRAVAAALMLIGIGFLSLLTATIASTFVSSDVVEDADARDEVARALERIEARLDVIERQLRAGG